MNENAMISTTDETGMVVMFAPAQTSMYCSVKANTPEQKKNLFNLTNGKTERLSDKVNTKINMVDLYAEEVEIVDKNTGELRKMPRIIIIDDKGVGYQCVSQGIFSSMKKLIGFMGEPTYSPAVTIMPKQVTTNNGNKVLTFEVV